MSKGKGYLIPDNPQPTKNDCMLVFFPDDQMYRWALVGALQFFTTWVAWEKDGTDKAKLAAEAWKAAYEETIQAMGCLDTVGTGLEAIADAIRATGGHGSGGSGGCCCAPANDTIGTPPDWWEDGDDSNPGLDPIEPPEGWDEPTHGAYNAYKCLAANVIVDDWIRTLTKFTSLGGLITTLGTTALLALFNTTFLGGLIVGLMTLGLTASGSVAILIGAFVVAIFVGSSVFALFNDMLTGFEREDAVCALYNATNVTTAKNALMNATQNAIDDIGAVPDIGAFQTLVDAITSVLIVDDLFRVLFNFETLATPALVVDCVVCSQAEIGIHTLRIHFDNSLAVPDSNLIQMVAGLGSFTMGGSMFQYDKPPEPFVQGAGRFTLDMAKFFEALGYTAPVQCRINHVEMVTYMRCENSANEYPPSSEPFTVQQTYFTDGTRFDGGVIKVVDDYVNWNLVSSQSASGLGKYVERFEWRYNAQGGALAVNHTINYIVDYVDITIDVTELVY